MDVHDRMTHVRIRELNDQLRTKGIGGRVMLTRAIAVLSPEVVANIIAAVRKFDAFTKANNPWDEHDFGQVEVDGIPYFWKIDAYDVNFEFCSPDPANESVTSRIMSIMTTSDL